MELLISGSSGLVGQALCAQLPRLRHSVTRLLRFGPASGTESQAEGAVAAWDPDAGLLDPGILQRAEAVVCLNGASIAARRWDRQLKQELIDSRVKPAALLATTLARLPAEQRPRVFVCCSAVGYYGTRPRSAQQDESAPSGDGFLAEICRAWEGACQPAVEAGIRVVNMRLGIVLASDGGPLAQMVDVIRRGIGGVVGSGRQEMSWICIHDIAPALSHVLEHPELSGPVNFAAPAPVSNAEMTRAVAETIGRRVGPPLPAFAARLVLGEMADELLLASQHVVPRKLLESGYVFQYSKLEPTLSSLLRGG
ncbi:TIGR01777 family oxidoreductase [bacterium]|nr:TIGR01777 family oxidoreductase [bacterium]